MFQGSIPPAMRSILREHARGWDVPTVYVGCSGNFTVERTLAAAGDFELHSNDVTLYSCAVGALLSGGELPVAVKPEWQEELGWFGESLRSPVDVAATMLLCSEMLKGVGSQNAYYRRIRVGYQRQWAEIHRQQVQKLETLKLRLASFHAGDAVTWFSTVPEDAAVACFPPFFTGGYEQMFRGLDEVFDWPAPTYEEMDDSRRRLLLDRMRGQRYWFFGTHQRQSDLESDLRGVVRTTSRGLPVYVYSSGGKTRIVQPRQKISHLLAPHLGPDDELGDKLSIIPLSSGQFTMLRSECLNARIKPASAALPCAVLVDGKLVGAFGYSAGSSQAQWDAHIQGPHVYLLSDFPIRPTRYRHLAKLVLYAALSKEAQALIEQMFSRRYRTLITTAFTDRPVSMKYRGLLRLLTRKDAGEDLEFRFQLSYGAPLGEWSLEEGLALWKRKHSEQVAA